eukprot:1043113_1
MFSSVSLALLFATHCLDGVSIPITNAGFEVDNPTLSANSWEFHDPAPSGWTVYESGADIYDESSGIQNPTGGDTYNDATYGDSAPEGICTTYIAVATHSEGDGELGLEQTLTGYTLTADVTYQLTAKVGNPTDNCFDSVPSGNKCTGNNLADGFPGYKLQLLAGGVVVDEDDDTMPTLAEATWGLSTVTFTPGPSHPQLSQTLGVRLLHKNDISSNGGLEIEFDDIQLNTVVPTADPTKSPSQDPSKSPPKYPTASPSQYPTDLASTSISPSKFPTKFPSISPSKLPSQSPTKYPSKYPSKSPTEYPSASPSKTPTKSPSNNPTFKPTKYPTITTTISPTGTGTTDPTRAPTRQPTLYPTRYPTRVPTQGPTEHPSPAPSRSPSHFPTRGPISGALNDPTPRPTRTPSVHPTTSPSHVPSTSPSQDNEKEAHENKLTVAYIVSVEVCEDAPLEYCIFDEEAIITKVSDAFGAFATTISNVETVDDTVIMELKIKANREIILDLDTREMEDDITDEMAPTYPNTEVEVKRKGDEDDDSQGKDESDADYVGFAEKYLVQIIIGIAIGLIALVGIAWCLCVCKLHKRERKLEEHVVHFNRSSVAVTGETEDTDVTNARGETISSDEPDGDGQMDGPRSVSQPVLLTPQCPPEDHDAILREQHQNMLLMHENMLAVHGENVVPGAAVVRVDSSGPSLPEDREDEEDMNEDLYAPGMPRIQTVQKCTL